MPPEPTRGTARDLQASGWKVLLSGLMGVTCGPKKPRVGHYLNFSSNASQVWGLASQVTSLHLSHCFPTESGKKENQAHRMVAGLTGMTWIKHLAWSANGSSFPFLCPSLASFVGRHFLPQGDGFHRVTEIPSCTGANCISELRCLCRGWEIDVTPRRSSPPRCPQGHWSWLCLWWALHEDWKGSGPILGGPRGEGDWCSLVEMEPLPRTLTPAEDTPLGKARQGSAP